MSMEVWIRWLSIDAVSDSEHNVEWQVDSKRDVGPH